ncbi:MAG TPA: hypothetical protein VL651_02115 [Bacteroidia bacterium]|jgi:hypothetical protein|nr:hypothetical protein [Bacteroidia bacterium]
MRSTLIILSLLLTVFCNADNGTLIVEGKYQNKNLYVQNSFSSSGVGFCAYEVYVNGERTTDEVNSSAFEIDLSSHNLKTGDKVEVQIFHKDGCEPRVLNPDALTPRPTFETTAIAISASGMLTWTTKNEGGALPFIIEQYRWSKWVYVGEVQGNGNATINNYSFQVTPIAGENRFRVKQTGFGKEVKYSPEVTFTPKDLKALTFTQSSDSKIITLSGESLYEMYDGYGNVVLKGMGSKIDLSDFDKGTYYLCFDNSVVDITRK